MSRKGWILTGYKMVNIDRYLLDALRCSIRNEHVDWETELTQKEWYSLIQAAQIHDVLPLLIQAIYQSQAFLKAESRSKTSILTRARRRAIYQASATAEFELLYSFLTERGLYPLVIKGIILRSLYPHSELRHSYDEDLLISKEIFPKYHQAMTDYGLTLVDPNEDIWRAYEVAYQDAEKHLYIEVHKSPFSPDSKAYGNLNDLFEGYHDRSTTVKVYMQEFYTLSPTDHFLYLLCHAYKHFLHSGVGIRQVADMALFSNTYFDSIDWEYIYSACQSIHIEVFAAALLRIAYRYLTMKTIPNSFAKIDIDEEPLLEDILTGGLYGVADINRAHSSNMTLHAVATQAKGRSSSGVWHSLFPGKAYLQNHFSYAKSYPILLPIAWANRIWNYLKRSNGSAQNPTESIRIGHARIELLKKYRIIDS